MLAGYTSKHALISPLETRGVKGSEIRQLLFVTSVSLQYPDKRRHFKVPSLESTWHQTAQMSSTAFAVQPQVCLAASVAVLDAADKIEPSELTDKCTQSMYMDMD